MSHEKPTEEIREQAALFSLGALTQHEADSFEAHIREGCPVCEAEYYKFKHITAEIGFASSEAVAPDYIRELILARIERETPEEIPEEIPEAESKQESAPTETAPTTSFKPMLSQPAREQTNIFPWILVAIFAVAVGFIYYSLYTEQIGSEQLKAEIDSRQTEIEDLETLLDVQKNRRGELEQIISTVSKPETRILHLAGYDPAPAASGAILWDMQLNKCLIFGYMPLVPPGRTYQLWYLTPSAKIPSGFLKPDPSGRIYEWFPIPENITSLTMVITLEPEGGSKIPSIPYYAIGRND